MSPLTIMLALRVALAGALYLFLGGLFWLIWQDLRGAARASQSRTQRLGSLVIIEAGQSGAQVGEHFPLWPVSSLGRAPTNTAPLRDDTASLEHALLHQRDGQWWLEDLGSRNGTRLNDLPISQPTPVLAGDVIGIGQIKLKLELN